MSLVDYHIHTRLCGHASGSPEEYINCALKNKIYEIGFSDHAPLPQGLCEGITMSPEETEGYITLIEELKERFKGDISIKIGFEVDFPLHSSFDRKYLADSRLDYLTGSCHFIDDWAFDHPDNLAGFDKRDIDEIYGSYYKIIRDLADSGYFNILGHFDLVKKFGHRAKADFTDALEDICRALSASNTAVEINTSGLRKPVEELYPSDDIIELFYRMNVPVTLGSDSHRPEEVGYRFDLAKEKIERAGYRKIAGFSKRKIYEIVL